MGEITPVSSPPLKHPIYNNRLGGPHLDSPDQMQCLQARSQGLMKICMFFSWFNVAVAVPDLPKDISVNMVFTKKTWRITNSHIQSVFFLFWRGFN